jgi:hypothetical protein
LNRAMQLQMAEPARPQPSSRPQPMLEPAAHVHEALASGGRPLDSATQDFFAPRFGHDFSRVRVHADTRAAASAQAVNALAYTVGNDVVFGPGQYRPQTAVGRNLLAHELAHTVQQQHSGAAASGPLPAGDLPLRRPGDGLERQAEDAGRLAADGSARGLPPRLTAAPGRCLQRQPAGPETSPAEQALDRSIREAAVRAAQKADEYLARQPGHIATVPQVRPAPTQPKASAPSGVHLPPEDLRPDPFAREPDPEPVKPAAGAAGPAGKKETPAQAKAPEAKKWEADPGEQDIQLAAGNAAQSGPGQAGFALQAADQERNVWGKARQFGDSFKLELGILQPTLATQFTHLWVFNRGGASAKHPLPPPDTEQLVLTVSPMVITLWKKLTITPQAGGGGAFAGDMFGTTKGPGRSGSHGQALGVINLQVDFKVNERFSVTGDVGYQGGKDYGPAGTNQVSNVTALFVGTFHFK